MILFGLVFRMNKKIISSVTIVLLLITPLITFAETVNEQIQPVQNSQGITSYLQTGKTSFEKKDFETAIKNFRLAYEKDPKNKEAATLLRESLMDYGIQLMKQGERDKGKNLLVESLMVSLGMRGL
jgi:hypothetical protein